MESLTSLGAPGSSPIAPESGNAGLMQRRDKRDSRRRLADALTERAGNTDPATWSQGLARITDGLVGGLSKRASNLTGGETVSPAYGLSSMFKPKTGTLF